MWLRSPPGATARGLARGTTARLTALVMGLLLVRVLVRTNHHQQSGGLWARDDDKRQCNARDVCAAQCSIRW